MCPMCALHIHIRTKMAIGRRSGGNHYIDKPEVKNQTRFVIFILKLINFITSENTLLPSKVDPSRHDICQNIYTGRLWTNYILPEKHNSQHITFWDKTV